MTVRLKAAALCLVAALVATIGATAGQARNEAKPPASRMPGMEMLHAAAPAAVADAKFIPGAAVAEMPRENADGTRDVRGNLSILWRMTEAGAAPEVILNLTCGAGGEMRLEAPEELARLHGGLNALDGRLVNARVRPKGQGEDLYTLVAVQPEPLSDQAARARVKPLDAARSKRWVTILVRFSDSADVTPHPKEYYEGLMGSEYPGMDHYWRECSYGSLNLAGSTVVGWYNLPQPVSYYWSGSGSWNFGLMWDDATAAADPDIDFSQYDGVQICTNINTYPFGYSRGWSGNLDGVEKSYHMISCPLNAQFAAATAAIMAMSMGASYSSGVSQWDLVSNNYAGLRTDPTYGFVPRHAIAYSKECLGVIAPERKHLVTAKSDSTVTLERLALPESSDSKLWAQVCIGGSATHFYTVEARRPAGYDQGSIPRDAVVIHEVDKSRTYFNMVWVVDADNNGDVNDDGAAWTPGEAFSDDVNGITISVLSATPTGYTVRIRVTNDTPPNVVNNTNDYGAGSLRNALQWVATRPGTPVIFNVPTSDPGYVDGVFHFRPRASYPQLYANGMVIDGATQTAYTGDTNPKGPEVHIDGSDAGPWATACVLSGSGCRVHCLAIGFFDAFGISVTGEGASNNTVTGCYVGTAATGDVAEAIRWCAVLIENGAHHNTVGGPTAAERNVLSGNVNEGVAIRNSNTYGNRVVGNYIGTDATGAHAIRNGAGVVIYAGSHHNTVGGTEPGMRNVISGSRGHGVHISNGHHNAVLGNYIGTDVTGSHAIGNSAGVIMSDGSQYNTVGDGTAAGRNVISGNRWWGVNHLHTNTSFNTTVGNYIGADATGMVSVPNGDGGVGFGASASRNTIGGASAGQRNIISGNYGNGVGLYDSGTDENAIIGNWVGVTADGKQPLGNWNQGIDIAWGPSRNRIGDAAPGEGNVVADSAGTGIWLYASGTNANRIVGNIVGLAPDGVTPMGNMNNGVGVVDGPADTVIGTDEKGGGNFISANHGDGIWLSAANRTVIQNNIVGLSKDRQQDRGNWHNGIRIQNGCTDTLVGGLGYMNGNDIGANRWTGVGIHDLTTTGTRVLANGIGRWQSFGDSYGWAMGNRDYGVYAACGRAEINYNAIIGNSSSGVVICNDASGVTVRANHISANGGLGIDIWYNQSGPSPTPNDPQDTDTGPNGVQNYPIITAAGLAAGVTQVTAALDSVPNTDFRIDFYIAEPDSSGHGEGSAWIAGADVRTDADGKATGIGTSFTSNLGQYLTATATNLATGETSEFSPNFYAGDELLQAFFVTPDRLVGGEDTMATLQLSAPAPAGGLKVLTTFAFFAEFPDGPEYIWVPEGAAEYSFPVATNPVEGECTIDIMACAGRAWYHAPVTILPGTTTVSVDDASGSIGKSAPLAATLLSKVGPLSGMTIDFKVDGTAVASAVTDGAGKAAHSLALTPAIGEGTHVLTALFAGSSPYGASSATGTLTVTKRATAVFVADRTARVRTSTVLKAYLFTESNVRLPAKSLEIKLDGVSVTTGETDAEGGVYAYYAIPDGVGVGVHPLVAAFAGDDAYKPATGSGKLTVTAGELYIWPYSRTARAGASHKLQAYVRSLPDYVAQAGKSVAFQVNGTDIGSGVSGADGWASATWAIPADEAAGAHTLTAAFAGDAWYNPVTVNTTFNVVK